MLLHSRNPQENLGDVGVGGMWGGQFWKNILMNVTREIVCVYPLRKSKAIDFVGIRCLLSLTLSFFFFSSRWNFLELLSWQRSEAQRREAMWQCTRLSGHLFQGASDLEALRASHRRANREDKGCVCLCNEALLLVQQGGSAYQIQFGSERLNLHCCLL